MKIALLGATGNLGIALRQKLLLDGHQVHALIHTGEATVATGLTYVKGDALDSKDISNIIVGCDAVIDTLGGDESSTIRSETAALVVKAMSEQHVQHLIIMGGSGVLGVGPWKFSQLPIFPNNKRMVTEDHGRVHKILLDSRLDWTQVCPSIMTEGPAVGKYKIRVGHPFLLWKHTIRLKDVADFIAKELIENRYIHQQVALIN